MAELRQAHWGISWGAPTRRDQRGGQYPTYVPDSLVTRPVVLSRELAASAARIETAVRGLTDTPGSIGLESLGRFLLRSEAIASSRIEGLQVSAQQVAIAELATTESAPIASITENARLVANNIVTLRKAAGTLADCPAIEPQSFCDLHRALLPDHPQQGLRDRQNWIGGSDWHPIGADFIPPPPEEVPRLVEDLADYLTGAVHAPLLQAALVHAQFATIHPFADGNGRVGRALIHTVLTRRGLTRAAVLPVSLVLLTRSQEYVEGLTAYRYQDPADGPAAAAGMSIWFDTFLQSVSVAVDQARLFIDQIADLQQSWAERYATHRAAAGAVRQAGPIQRSCGCCLSCPSDAWPAPGGTPGNPRQDVRRLHVHRDDTRPRQPGVRLVVGPLIRGLSGWCRVSGGGAGPRLGLRRSGSRRRFGPW